MIKFKIYINTDNPINRQKKDSYVGGGYKVIHMIIIEFSTIGKISKLGVLGIS